MRNILDYPLLLSAAAVVVQGLAAYLGEFVRWRTKPVQGAKRAELGTILPAALTLLGLIIGFTFSMAVTRYEQRKDYEAAEANAIGTEYARADLLPAAEAARVRELLARYVTHRILFYQARNREQLERIDAETVRLHNELWSAITPVVTAQPTPVAAIVASGMNDVLNSQSFTQAAWWNRIPVGAWALMGVVAIACNLLVGYGEWRANEGSLLILPLIVAVSVFFIADMDSPRGGAIVVAPQNLIALSKVLSAQ